MVRLYLDNAATSFPKPPCVHEAMLRYGTTVGGTAGRGSYFEAREGGRIIQQCRQRICAFINGEDANHVVFTLNTSDALNLAINGVIGHRRVNFPGKVIHAITTDLDHNSVLRPLNAQAEEGVQWTCVAADPQTGVVSAEAIRRALRPETALVAVNHASNVTGALQPVAAIGAVCRAAGVLFLTDIAQSLGHIPVDVQAMNIDLAAFPGHKGLLGPLGTGGLYLRPGIAGLVRPVRVGGTGSRSEQETQPETMPDRYEPGSQNAVGIAGLGEAVKWLADRGAEVFRHDRALRQAMLKGLAELKAWGPGAGANGMRLLGPTGVDARVGVFSLTHELLSPQEIAAVLEQEYGILVRAGLHCAPRAHAAMGTRETGGAVRLSVGAFNSVEDVTRACGALGEVCDAATRAAARA